MATPTTAPPHDSACALTGCRFSCTLDAATASPLPHVWEHTIGSGHATLALRADWQGQLLRCRRELGFRHVRLHGILCDDMGTLVREEGALVYSFFNADQICDFLLSIDMRPFVELSFMPTALASKDDTVFHYHGNITPPKDYEAWETLVRKLVHHWVERYGSSEVRRWFFEIWNEPKTALETASSLVRLPVAFRMEGDTATFEVDVPPQGAALVTLQLT